MRSLGTPRQLATCLACCGWVALWFPCLVFFCPFPCVLALMARRGAIERSVFGSNSAPATASSGTIRSAAAFGCSKRVEA
eukprot:2360655-Pyramimonas_sp.AAC.1